MDVSAAIQTKRAVRRFAPTPLPEEVARAILNAGRRAQSSKNSQPWQFIAVTDRDTLRRLAGTGTYADHLAGAALGVVLVTAGAPAAPDAAETSGWIMFDLGQAASYMQLAAWELGVGSVIATIYEPDAARAILGIPAGMGCDVALSFGYPADTGDMAAAPRAGGRRPLEEMLHRDRW
ncbi:MAG TPA: nitroreductase family protein [Ktedonobacterales bacterium]|nr:nitroreductase family protein [Ktedonobacterales bacterium]